MSPAHAAVRAHPVLRISVPPGPVRVPVRATWRALYGLLASAEARAQLLDDVTVEAVMAAQVTWHGIRPSRAQRVTVFGDTPSSLETSARVMNCVADPSGGVRCLVASRLRLTLSLAAGRMKQSHQKHSLSGLGYECRQ